MSTSRDRNAISTVAPNGQVTRQKTHPNEAHSEELLNRNGEKEGGRQVLVAQKSLLLTTKERPTPSAFESLMSQITPEEDQRIRYEQQQQEARIAQKVRRALKEQQEHSHDHQQAQALTLPLPLSQAPDVTGDERHPRSNTGTFVLERSPSPSFVSSTSNTHQDQRGPLPAIKSQPTTTSKVSLGGESLSNTAAASQWVGRIKRSDRRSQSPSLPSTTSKSETFSPFSAKESEQSSPPPPNYAPVVEAEEGETSLFDATITGSDLVIGNTFTTIGGLTGNVVPTGYEEHAGMLICQEALKTIQSQGKNISPFASDKYFPMLSPAIPKNRGKILLCLDIDETMLHSTLVVQGRGQPPSHPYEPCDVRLPADVGEGAVGHVCVNIRPHLHTFLLAISPLFDIAIFTASRKAYADLVMDVVDPHRALLGNQRLYREHCAEYHNARVKDLSLLGRPLDRIALLDNTPIAYKFQPRNAIPISSYFKGKDDTELLKLIPMLRRLAVAKSVFDVLDHYNAHLISPEPSEVMTMASPVISSPASFRMQSPRSVHSPPMSHAGSMRGGFPTRSNTNNNSNSLNNHVNNDSSVGRTDSRCESLPNREHCGPLRRTAEAGYQHGLGGERLGGSLMTQPSSNATTSRNTSHNVNRQDSPSVVAASTNNGTHSHSINTTKNNSSQSREPTADVLSESSTKINTEMKNNDNHRNHDSKPVTTTAPDSGESAANALLSALVVSTAADIGILPSANTSVNTAGTSSVLLNGPSISAALGNSLVTRTISTFGHTNNTSVNTNDESPSLNISKVCGGHQQPPITSVSAELRQSSGDTPLQFDENPTGSCFGSPTAGAVRPPSPSPQRLSSSKTKYGNRLSAAIFSSYNMEVDPSPGANNVLTFSTSAGSPSGVKESMPLYYGNE